MPAYWIARVRVNDPERYRRYAERVPAIVDAHGGRFLARGGEHRVMEGPPPPYERFVVIEFPSMERAVACFESPAYREAAAFRRDGAGEVEVVFVEGV